LSLTLSHEHQHGDSHFIYPTERSSSTSSPDVENPPDGVLSTCLYPSFLSFHSLSLLRSPVSRSSPLFDDVLMGHVVDFNGTLTTPSCQGGYVIGTPLPGSSPHPCNVSGVSRGRIPITVHLMCLHELGPLRTRSTLVYL
jgi:hypothetical protein